MKLLLVRHGRTIANVMGALDTAFPGNDLDEVGLGQAARVPDRLERLGHLEGITSLWVSPIARARQTITPLERATGLQAQVRAGLREVLAGDTEMRTDHAAMACYRDTTRAWMTGWPHARIPGSPENGVDTFNRFNAVVTEIAEVAAPGAIALLVAHGTVLRLWTALAAARSAGADPRWIATHPLPNTGLAVVTGDVDQGWTLQDWNEGQWSARGAQAGSGTDIEGGV